MAQMGSSLVGPIERKPGIKQIAAHVTINFKKSLNAVEEKDWTHERKPWIRGTSQSWWQNLRYQLPCPGGGRVGRGALGGGTDAVNVLQAVSAKHWRDRQTETETERGGERQRIC